MGHRTLLQGVVEELKLGASGRWCKLEEGNANRLNSILGRFELHLKDAALTNHKQEHDKIIDFYNYAYINKDAIVSPIDLYTLSSSNDEKLAITRDVEKIIEKLTRRAQHAKKRAQRQAQSAARA